MNLLSKKTIIPMAAIALIGAGAYGLTSVSAASDPSNPHANIVQKIADTFHLDPSKVQAVFDQNRAQNQADRQTDYDTRLAQAVTDGTLTSAQKDLIVAENTKLKSELSAAGTTPDARRAAMKNVRTEARTWATQNNIAVKWLMAGMGGHPRGGMGDQMMGQPSSTSSPSPSVN
jgi:hypothetical protein